MHDDRPDPRVGVRRRPSRGSDADGVCSRGGGACGGAGGGGVDDDQGGEGVAGGHGGAAGVQAAAEVPRHQPVPEGQHVVGGLEHLVAKHRVGRQVQGGEEQLA